MDLIFILSSVNSAISVTMTQLQQFPQTEDVTFDMILNNTQPGISDILFCHLEKMPTEYFTSKNLIAFYTKLSQLPKRKAEIERAATLLDRHFPVRP